MDEPNLYATIFNELERTHLAMRSALRTELTLLSADINEIQAMIIHGIGNKTLTSSDIRSTGCYNGTNASYNLNELIRLGYITKKIAKSDKRSVTIKLTGKGTEMMHSINEILDRRLEKLLTGGRKKRDLLELFVNLRTLQVSV